MLPYKLVLRKNICEREMCAVSWLEAALGTLLLKSIPKVGLARDYLLSFSYILSMSLHPEA